MKHKIFTTYGETPIKNIKTPIRRFNGDGEDEDFMPNNLTYASECTEAQAATIELLEHIRALLVVIIIVKIICLCFKK